MRTADFDGEPISPGLGWEQVVNAPGQIGAAMRFSAHIRRKASGPDIAELTSENGGFVRIDDDSFRLAWEAPAGLATGQVEIAIKRTDLTPERWLGITLLVPVTLSGTE